MAVKDFLEWVERKGLHMRRRLGLSPSARLDPYALAQRMGVFVVTPHDAVQLDAEILEEVLGAGARSWSGGCFHLPNGGAVVVLNPTHALTRTNATLMEELVHIDLKHPPSEIIRVGPVTMRNYKKTYETQAYWVGCAALVPRHRLQQAVQEGLARSALADECGVSKDLIVFRERVTGVKL